jgi:hypothetical protein
MRTTNTVPVPVLGRMGYTNPSIVRNWRKIFSKPVSQKTETKRDHGSFVINRSESPVDFDRIAFVLKARSKDEKREYLTVLHVEQTSTGSRLIATDGLRLHFAEIERKIESGEYKPAVHKDCIRLGDPVKDIQFPNYARIIPENTIKRGVIDLTDTGMGKDRNQTERLSWVFNSFVKKTGDLINLRYLEDLTKKKWLVYCQSEKHKAIVLKEFGAENSVFAVVMPLAKTGAVEEAA